jgi:hypothetical protein
MHKRRKVRQVLRDWTVGLGSIVILAAVTYYVLTNLDVILGVVRYFACGGWDALNKCAG